MKLQYVSIKGSSPWNEDALVVQEKQQMYGVIDGATSLTPYAGANGETGGYFAAQIVANSLRSNADQVLSGKINLAEAILTANDSLRAEMLRSGLRIERKEELWGACAVIVKITETAVEFVQTGDCMLMALYRDGSIRAVTRDQIAHLDRETHRLWAEGAAQGLTTREQLWNYVKPQIVSGRQTTNTSDGYAVLNGEPELARYLESGMINRINLQALLLMTDGLYMPKYANEKMFNSEEVAAAIAEMGLETYVDQLIEREESDPDCLIYPRVKKSDDKTAIWIEL